ncbi:hypothetical protein, partial [Vreelandella rituensis]|uniref:hypothetical protein n=1 Tax=Vreelandella rituensis TaxID=2282306 RepID=UPI0039F126CE
SATGSYLVVAIRTFGALPFTSVILTFQSAELSEAFGGGSRRPIANVAGWLPLSLVNRACCHKPRPLGRGS